MNRPNGTVQLPNKVQGCPVVEASLDSGGGRSRMRRLSGQCSDMGIARSRTLVGCLIRSQVAAAIGHCGWLALLDADPAVPPLSPPGGCGTAPIGMRITRSRRTLKRGSEPGQAPHQPTPTRVMRPSGRLDR